MKRTLVLIGASSLFLGVLFTASAVASDTDDLIALDKKWGESGIKGDISVSEKLLSEQVVSVTPNGVRGKKGELADNQPPPGVTKYEPTDYKVTFLNPDTAIMTHATKGGDAHYSLHVWSRKNGNWQIVATSVTAASKE